MTIDSFDIVFYTAVFVLPGFIINSIIDAMNPPKKHNDGIYLLCYFPAAFFLPRSYAHSPFLNSMYFIWSLET